jgi:hypothetical protein
MGPFPSLMSDPIEARTTHSISVSPAFQIRRTVIIDQFAKLQSASYSSIMV